MKLVNLTKKLLKNDNGLFCLCYPIDEVLFGHNLWLIANFIFYTFSARIGLL